jgi:hypothetical protein
VITKEGAGAFDPEFAFLAVGDLNAVGRHELDDQVG